MDLASFLNDEEEQKDSAAVAPTTAASTAASAESPAAAHAARVAARRQSSTNIRRDAPAPGAGEEPAAGELPTAVRDVPALVREESGPVEKTRPAASAPAPAAPQAAPFFEENLLSELAPFVAAAVDVAVVEEPRGRAPAKASAPPPQLESPPAPAPPPAAVSAPPAAVSARPAAVSAPPAAVASARPPAASASPAAVSAPPAPVPSADPKAPSEHPKAPSERFKVPSERKLTRSAPPAAAEALPDGAPTKRISVRAAALAAAEVVNERSSKRLPFEVAVTIHSEHNFYAGLSLNISEGGLFVATHVEHPVGTRLEIHVLLPGDSEPTAILTEVRWVRPHIDHADGSAGLGLRFLGLSPALMARIHEFVQSRDPLYYDEDF